MLACFDISKETDAQGNEVPIEPTYMDGLTAYALLPNLLPI
jgi:hypothetical protein